MSARLRTPRGSNGSSWSRPTCSTAPGCPGSPPAVARAVVEVEHVLERRQLAAVHIGRRVGEISQALRAERVGALRPAVGGAFLVVGHAQHVQLVVAEHRPFVAAVAARVGEDRHPANLRRRHRRGVAVHIAVERGGRCHKRALEAGQRPAQILAGDDRAGAERLGEQWRVGG